MGNIELQRLKISLFKVAMQNHLSHLYDDPNLSS